jgi:hypothetical protein
MVVRGRVAFARRIGHDPAMSFFKEGQKVWVERADGSQRPGIYVGEAETAVWFGGAPVAYVVYPDTREGESVPLAHIVPRDE